MIEERMGKRIRPKSEIMREWIEKYDEDRHNFVKYEREKDERK